MAPLQATIVDPRPAIRVPDGTAGITGASSNPRIGFFVLLGVGLSASQWGHAPRRSALLLPPKREM